MDITQALKDTENALRDFIASVLRSKFSESWMANCGVTEERIKRWEERKLAEEKRQASGVVEERLLYYADFYDLRTILKKHWSSEFSEALGDWRTMEVWLMELEKLRDPDAHRRELLPHQKHLVLGISGEIRTRIVRYRSKQETSDGYYPRIESARDNFGNIYTFGSPHSVDTKTMLKVNDLLQFVVTASDPFGADLRYRIVAYGLSPNEASWKESNELSIVITDNQVRKRFGAALLIASPRKYHAREDYDDEVVFNYEVLPPRD